jgi:hypothetical protein
MVPPSKGEPPLDYVDPADCAHTLNIKLGIQRFPFPPFRVYLLRCARCDTTLTTGSMREQKQRGERPAIGGGCHGGASLPHP